VLGILAGATESSATALSSAGTATGDGALFAMPRVFAGRMIQHFGSFRLTKGHGSGMIRLVWKVGPPKGGALRLGNTNPFVGSVRGGAFAAPRRFKAAA
jgi:hypothetical protein